MATTKHTKYQATRALGYNVQGWTFEISGAIGTNAGREMHLATNLADRNASLPGQTWANQQTYVYYRHRIVAAITKGLMLQLRSLVTSANTGTRTDLSGAAYHLRMQRSRSRAA